MTTPDTKFDPKRPNETELFGIDLKRVLTTGETISEASVTIAVKSGSTHSTTTMVSGSAVISGSKVTQKITGGVSGNRYDVRFGATTSLGQHIEVLGELLVRD